MNCDRSRTLLPRLADRALDPLRRLLVTRHIARCAGCAAQYEELLSMQTALRTSLLYHRAPPGLAVRIGAALSREALPAAPRPRLGAPGWRFAGSGLAGVAAGVALMLLVTGQPPENAGDAVVRAAIASHIRSMMADHLTDVATSDRHTVKPWLSARLDVSPPVHDLAAAGFPLVGGRLDYIDGHAAAAVVYRHDRHVINLFAWAAPSMGNAAPSAEQRQGFNVVRWRRDGVAYCAVSDLEADLLLTFVRDVRDGG